MFETLFRDSITRKVEKKRKLEGEIALLKKQQKVKSEAVIKDYDKKKVEMVNNINAEIIAYKANIDTLTTSISVQSGLLEQEKKVELDKVINDFDQRIIAKQNKLKRVINFIDAEKKNMQDVISTELPNAPQQVVKTEEPKKILLETTSKKQITKRGRPIKQKNK